MRLRINYYINNNEMEYSVVIVWVDILCAYGPYYYYYFFLPLERKKKYKNKEEEIL